MTCAEAFLVSSTSDDGSVRRSVFAIPPKSLGAFLEKVHGESANPANPRQILSARLVAAESVHGSLDACGCKSAAALPGGSTAPWTSFEVSASAESDPFAAVSSALSGLFGPVLALGPWPASASEELSVEELAKVRSFLACAAAEPRPVAFASKP